MISIKEAFYRSPDWVQRKFGWRLRSLLFSKEKKVVKKNALHFLHLSRNDRKNYIFIRVKDICLFAQKHNTFYRDYYKKADFDPKSLDTYEDLSSIPIVNKQLLIQAGKDWNMGGRRSLTGNTGGTSGSPLEFSFDKKQLVKESYYIEDIFSNLGCKPADGRLVFRGLNELGANSWAYHPESDSYLINTYLSLEDMESDLYTLFKTKKINFLHGYPSAIYQFAKSLSETKNSLLRDLVINSIQGVLYGSEYPAPVYREVIEGTFRVPSVSWYGHSERVVLASEIAKPYVYNPYHSYGWCEAVPSKDDTFHLVGTDYSNYYSPFIRYDTGDLIEPLDSRQSVLGEFRIAQGRVGDFIYDARNKPISLTSLIFGRHHKVFGIADFIQIHQSQPGMATLILVINDRYADRYAEQDLKTLLDLEHVAIKFDVVQKTKPYRTALGKVPLIVPTLEY